jgi:hypothetical protein
MEQSVTRWNGDFQRVVEALGKLPGFQSRWWPDAAGVLGPLAAAALRR